MKERVISCFVTVVLAVMTTVLILNIDGGRMDKPALIVKTAIIVTLAIGTVSMGVINAFCED